MRISAFVCVPRLKKVHFRLTSANAVYAAAEFPARVRSVGLEYGRHVSRGAPLSIERNTDLDDPWGESVFAVTSTCISYSTRLFPTLRSPLPTQTVPKATDPNSQKPRLPTSIPTGRILGAGRSFGAVDGRLIRGVQQGHRKEQASVVLSHTPEAWYRETTVDDTASRRGLRPRLRGALRGS